MPSMERRIKRMNVKKLRIEDKNETELECKCRKDCPMEGKCKDKEIVYRAEIKSKEGDNEIVKKYVGLTATPFIERYRNHVYSFNKPQMKNATELSKYIWKIKEEGRNYEIKWEIIRRAKAYKPGGKYCNLCTSEAIAIVGEDVRQCLNSRSEILKQCRHKAKWKLENFKKFGT